MLWSQFCGVALLTLSVLQSVSGHMQLFSPIARGDPRNKGYGEIAPRLNAALFGGGAPGKYPCRFQREGPITAKYTAGKDFITEFMQGSPHMGGHCQFAISYDNGKNWVVLRTIIDMCFMGIAPYRYAIPLPKGARNGRALLAWTFINAGGNVEYYMNCADIEIDGGSENGSLTGPELLVVRRDGKPDFPKWANKDASKDGKEHFTNRKIVTIPVGAQATPDGTVVGEPGGGKPGSVTPPSKIPWDRFVPSKFADYNSGHKKLRTDLGPTGKDLTQFFVATSDDYRGGTTGGKVDMKLTPTTVSGKDEPPTKQAASSNDVFEPKEGASTIENGENDKGGENGKNDKTATEQAPSDGTDAGESSNKQPKSADDGEDNKKSEKHENKKNNKSKKSKNNKKEKKEKKEEEEEE